nr:hydrolase [uncultured Tyzzerella sp.]
MFFGYIFTKKIIDNNIINIVAYNSIRYLVARDTYIYKNKTASQVLKMICADFGLKTGNIEDTSYIIPYRIEENQTILDIIYKSLELTKNFNNKNYILFDDFGKISLKSYENMKLPIVIDCDKYILQYKYISSIDKNVYNSVKVSVKNRKTKVISTYLQEDATNKKKWGTLRKFERLPNDFNSVQAKNYAKNILNIHNKLNEKMEILCFGDEKVSSGNIINILINKQSKTMMVEQCSHIIKNNEHLMKLTLTNL